MINPGLCEESVEEWKEIISLANSNSAVMVVATATSVYVNSSSPY